MTYFGPCDIPHIGYLYKLVRKTKDIEESDLARELGIRVNAITNFEDPRQTNLPRGKDKPRKRSVVRAKETQYFEKLVDALREEHVGEKRVKAPLKDTEAAKLKEMYSLSNSVDMIEAAEERLFTINLKEIKQFPTEELRTLHNKLKTETRPAYIADQLWFIHAINGAALNLFNIDPKAEYTLQWEAWHALGTKFSRNSPALKTYVGVNQHYPQMVNTMFQDTYRIMFTMQMRALLERLHALSKQNKITEFEKWWHNTITFSLAWQEEAFLPTLKYWGKEQDHREDNYREIRAGVETHFAEGQEGLYWICIWNPKWSTSDSTSVRLEGLADNSEIYYAHDFEEKARQVFKGKYKCESFEPFHVNEWLKVNRYFNKFSHP